jgi:hypothetical protein
MNDNEIILSICMSARNDDYSRDFKRRFEQSMNFLAHEAMKAGVLHTVEVLCTDWNSIVPLAEALELSDDASKMVRFLIIPPSLAGHYNYGNTPFHTTISANAAIRRAKGCFVAFMPGDILVPEFTIGRLIRLIGKEISAFFDPHKSLMCVPRKLIPENFDDAFTWSGLTSDEIARSLATMDFCLESSYISPGAIGGGGMFVLHRDIIEELQGFDEKLGGWGNSDHYFALEAARKYPIINLAGMGLVVYDFEPDAKLQATKRARTNPYAQLGFRARNENWGLLEHSLEIIGVRERQGAHHARERNKIYQDPDEVLARILDGNFDVALILKLISKTDPDFEYFPEFTPLIQLIPSNKAINYLDICSHEIARTLLSTLNPFSNLYIIPPLGPDGAMSDEQLDRLFLSSYRAEKPHLGTIRCIPNFPEQALLDLKESHQGEDFTFDMIRLSCDFLKEGTFAFFEGTLYDILADNGIMVIHGKRQYYQNFCTRAKAGSLDYTLVRCDRLCIGLLMKTRGISRVIEDMKTQRLLHRAWMGPIRRSIIHYIFYEITRLYARAARSLRVRMKSRLNKSPGKTPSGGNKP